MSQQNREITAQFKQRMYLSNFSYERSPSAESDREKIAGLAGDQAMLLLNNFCICRGAPGRTGFVVHIEDERKTIIMAAGINLNSNSSQAYRVILTFKYIEQMIY